LKRTEKSELKVLEIDKMEQLADRVRRRHDWGEVLEAGCEWEELAVIGCLPAVALSGIRSLSWEQANQHDLGVEKKALGCWTMRGTFGLRKEHW